jgi:hypothetical protein
MRTSASHRMRFVGEVDEGEGQKNPLGEPVVAGLQNIKCPLLDDLTMVPRGLANLNPARATVLFQHESSLHPKRLHIRFSSLDHHVELE